MGVGCPRGRLRHRRGRGALTSHGFPPARRPRGAPRRQTSVRHPAARPPCGTPPPDLRAARARILLSMAALCAGGRRPAREIATRELRSECSISRPALALPPPTGTAATSTPAGLAPPNSRAAMTTCTTATFTQQASRRPPVGRLVLPGPATAHRHRSHTTNAAATPASAANPPSNTNYTKRPGQQPHKQTVNNLRAAPGLNQDATTWRR